MTYYGILDVGLHFHFFRNIDLYNQGLYRLQCRVYYDTFPRSITEKDVPKKSLYSRGIPAPGADSNGVTTDLSFECIVGHPYAFSSGALQKEFGHTISSQHSDARGSLNGTSGQFNTKRLSSEALINNNEVYPSLAILPESQSCLTSSFLVENLEQEIEINELCQFRLEFDLCKEKALLGPVYIEIDLMFADPVQSEGSDFPKFNGETKPKEAMIDNLEFFDSRLSSSVPQGKNKSWLMSSQYDKRFSDSQTSLGTRDWKFQSVAFQAYRIHNACQGIHQYLPVIFNEYHFSLCTVSVHTCLIDIRRRLTSNSLPCSYRPRYRDKYYASGMDGNNSNAMVEERKSVKPYTSFLKPTDKDISPFPDVTEAFRHFLCEGHQGLIDFNHTYVYSMSGIHQGILNDTYPGQHLNLYEEASDKVLNNPVTPDCNHRVFALPCYQSPHTTVVATLLDAEKLHLRYFCVLLESFCEAYFFSRRLFCRALDTKERKTLGSAIEFPPLSLPGGESIELPGSQDTWMEDVNFFSPDMAIPDATRTLSGSHLSRLASYESSEAIELHICIPVHALLTELYRVSKDRSYDSEKLHCFLQNKKKRVQLTASIPRLSSRLETTDAVSVSSLITNDFQHLAVQLLALWHQCSNLLPSINVAIMSILEEEYRVKKRSFWQECIVRETLSSTQLVFPLDNTLCETHQSIATQIRQTLRNPFYEHQLITDIFRIPTPDSRPIFFEQRYFKEVENAVDPLTMSNGTNPIFGTQNHLVVLVHGFQGNSYDMRLLRNVLNSLYPELFVLCSSVNEQNSEGDVDEMGLRLSIEIKHFIEEHSLIFTLSRLSFIAHSLGGIIVRAALMHLTRHWPKLHTFLSLASPHLGYMYSSNRWVEAGIWFLKKWKKCVALQQLTLSDAKDIENTYLYKLSQNSQSLGHFRHLCLVSSCQDHYVPFESSRVEISHRAQKDVRFGPAYIEMAMNILGNIDASRLRRFDIHFSVAEKSFDSMIGRTAHIQFLDHVPWMYMLLETLDLIRSWNVKTSSATFSSQNDPSTWPKMLPD